MSDEYAQNALLAVRLPPCCSGPSKLLRSQDCLMSLAFRQSWPIGFRLALGGAFLFSWLPGAFLATRRPPRSLGDLQDNWRPSRCSTPYWLLTVFLTIQSRLGSLVPSLKQVNFLNHQRSLSDSCLPGWPSLSWILSFLLTLGGP